MGEDGAGERKSKRERRAEYSAAVSRLADSGRSCSECTMRGRQRAQETAVKQQKEKKARRREQVHVCGKNAYKCAWFCQLILCFYACICAGTQACERWCVCARVNTGVSLAVW